MMRQRRAEFDATRRKRFVRGQKSQERSRRRFASRSRQAQAEPVEEIPLHDEDDEDDEDEPAWHLIHR